MSLTRLQHSEDEEDHTQEPNTAAVAAATTHLLRNHSSSKHVSLSQEQLAFSLRVLLHFNWLCLICLCCSGHLIPILNGNNVDTFIGPSEN